MSGADPGFFLGGGALVSCSTSTPINHIVFFRRIPVVLENRRSSQGGRGAHPPPRSAPVCTLHFHPVCPKAAVSFFLMLAHIWLCISQTAFGLGSVYAQSLVLFTFLRFATALSMMGFYVVQYVYILEIVGRDYRTMVGLCAFIFWLPGEDVTVLIAYYIREWRRLLLVLSCPPALFIFLCL